MVDDWLLGLFRTNQDVWRFLEYLGEQLEAGEPVPKEIHVFTVATTGIAEIIVLDTQPGTLGSHESAAELKALTAAFMILTVFARKFITQCTLIRVTGQ